MDVMDVGVRISMINAISPGLRSIAGEVLGLNREFDRLAGNINRVSTRQQIAIGAAGAVALGAGILKVWNTLEEHGEKIIQNVAVLNAGLNASLSIAEKQKFMAEATAAAWKESTNNLQSTAAENLKAITDLYNVFQDPHHAIDFLPDWNKSAAVRKNLIAGGADSNALGDSNVMGFMQAFERMWGADMPKMHEAIDKTNQMAIALAGRIGGKDYNTQISKAGSASILWDMDFATKTFPALMQVMKGGAGAPAYQAFRNLYGGVASGTMQADAQVAYGLQSNDNWKDKTHKKPGFEVGSGFEANLMASNPQKWANDVIDLWRKNKPMGVDVDNQESMQKAIIDVARSNKGLQQFLDELLLPQQRTQLARETNKMNLDPGAADQLAEDSPAAWRNKVSQQWDNALDSLGQTMVPELVDRVLKPLAAGLNDVAIWAKDHPDLVSGIAKSLGVLGVALIALGIAAGIAVLAFAGVPGLVAAALAAVVAAIVLFADKIKAVASAIGNALSIGGSTQGQADSAIKALGNQPHSGLAGHKAGGGHVSHGSGYIVGENGPEYFSPDSSGNITPNHRLAGFSPRPGGGGATEVHIYATLDGEVVHRSVTRRMAQEMTHATSAPMYDTSRDWMGGHSQFAAG